MYKIHGELESVQHCCDLFSPGPVVLNLDSDGAALELRVALPVSPVVLDGGVPDSRVGGGPGQPQLAVLAGAGGALSVEEAKERLEGTQ